MTKTKVLIITAIGIAILFALGSLFLKKEAKAPTAVTSNEQLIKFHSPTMGKPDAKVTIVEFLDPECESCAGFYPTMKGLLNDYKDNVRFVVRYMTYHKNSRLAAIATEAAGRQGKYWEMQAQLFNNHEWTHQETPQGEIFEKIAAGLNLDLAKFREDMKDPGIAAGIDSDFQEGPSLGVRGTPTIFVNGKMLMELSYIALKDMIESELRN